MAVIEYSQLLKVSLGDEAFAKEIVQRFLRDASVYKHVLDRGLRNKDFIEIKKVLQQLKSSAQVFGAVTLVENIRKVEMADLTKYDQYEGLVKSTYSLLQDLEKEAAGLPL